MYYSILDLIIIMAPMTLGGILHMIIIKLPIFPTFNRPVDGGITLTDGRRLFGTNKTWKGFISMPLGTAISFMGFEWCWRNSTWLQDHSLFDFTKLGWLHNSWWLGLYLGFVYLLAELPNSFIKRRLGIPPGQNKSNFLGKVFMVVDHVDSTLGCAIAFAAIIPITLLDIATLTIIGGIIHYTVAVSLFYVGLKKQRG